MAWVWLWEPAAPEGRPVPVPPEGLDIGRDPACGLVLADAGASRRHARLGHDGLGWVIEDLGSANGTWIGPERVQVRRLQPGEPVRIGATTLVLAEEAPAAAPAPSPAAVAAKPAGGPPRRWLLGLLAAALVATVGIVAWFGLRAPGSRWRPTPIPETRVPAVDLEPVPGLRIQAERGALDTPRSFRAAVITREASARLLEKAQADGLLPLGGFQVDAGMGPEDRFAKPVRFIFDLERMGIPAELAPGLQILRIEESGRVERLPVRLEGRRVVVEARHNAGFVAAWGPLGILLALMVAPLWSQVDKGAFNRHWYDDVDAHWHVCWPKAMKYRETPEVLRVAGILQERRKFHLEGPALSQPFLEPAEYQLQRLAAFLRDPQVKACEKLAADVDWKIQHLYPAEVAHTVIALRHAGEYLWEVRKFRKRSGRVEVWVQQPWAHGTEYALTIDNATTYPYIQVNGDKLPSRYPAPAPKQKDVDSLETTMVHEVFHVIQKEYFNTTKYLNPGHFLPGGARYEWFNEATAPVIEEEAEAHYKAKGWVTSWESTFAEFQKFGQSVWGQLRLPLDDTGADESGTRQKGYAASRFLMHLRDTYCAGNKDAFLPKLMETYCSFWTGPVDALVKSTSSSRQVLGLDYLAFCEKNAGSITVTDPNPASLTLSRGNPIGSWGPAGPLSAPALRIGLPTGPDAKGARLLLRPPKGLGEKVAHSWAWSPELRKAGAFSLVRAWPFVQDVKGAGMMVHRIEYDPDAAKGRGPEDVKLGAADDRSTTALLLLPAKDPPRIRTDTTKKSLHVEIPESPLWRAGEVLEYRVRFYGSLKGNKPLPVSLGRGRREADIDIAQIMGTQRADPQSGLMMKQLMQVLSQQDLKDMLALAEFAQRVQGTANEMTVTYTEVVRGDPGNPDDKGVEGPESPVFRVPAESQLGGIDFGIDGTWRGQIPFVHERVTFRTGSPGIVTVGTEHMYFRVAGPAQFGGTTLEYLAQERDRYVPTGVQVYVYRLPGRKLWLTIPTAVLYPDGAGKAEDPGWWEYFFGSKARK